MRTSTRSALLIAAALLTAACAGLGTDTAATVNGEAIAIDSVERQVRAQVADPNNQVADGPDRVQAVADLQNQVLSSLIRLRIVDQLATDQGIEVSADEVQEQWEQIAAQQTDGEDGLLELLDRLGLTEAEARDQLRVQVAQNKLQQQVTADTSDVSRQELRQAYQDRADQYEVADVAHILLDTEEQAQDVLDELDAGASFATLAEERSNDPGSSAQGGELGTVPLARLVPEFSQAVRDAEVGEVVGPVETQFGFHVIRVDAYEQRSFADVEDELRAELAGASAQEAFNQLFQDALNAAEVEVSARFGEWNAGTASVQPTAVIGSRQDPQPGAAPSP